MAEVFDFEAYWKEHGIVTSPAIMELAFKELVFKAVQAVEAYYQSHQLSVYTTTSKHDDQYTEEALPKRIWGVPGKIIGKHNSHGLCYDVLHEDGSIGTYDPDELELFL